MDRAKLDYRWSFCDGGSATGPNATHTFNLPGSQRATLTVTDDEGGTSTASVAVNVLPAGGGGGGGGGPRGATFYAAAAAIIVLVVLVLAFIMFRKRGKAASPDKGNGAPPVQQEPVGPGGAPKREHSPNEPRPALPIKEPEPAPHIKEPDANAPNGGPGPGAPLNGPDPSGKGP